MSPSELQGGQTVLSSHLSLDKLVVEATRLGLAELMACGRKQDATAGLGSLTNEDNGAGLQNFRGQKGEFLGPEQAAPHSDKSFRAGLNWKHISDLSSEISAPCRCGFFVQKLQTLP
jgi:hypothetical protein